MIEIPKYPFPFIKQSTSFSLYPFNPPLMPLKTLELQCCDASPLLPIHPHTASILASPPSSHTMCLQRTPLSILNSAISLSLQVNDGFTHFWQVLLWAYSSIFQCWKLFPFVFYFISCLNLLAPYAYLKSSFVSWKLLELRRFSNNMQRGKYIGEIGVAVLLHFQTSQYFFFLPCYLAICCYLYTLCFPSLFGSRYSF